MQKNWYAVYTKPQNEKKVAVSFSKKKMETFCPMGAEETMSFFGIKKVQKPLFPSYVFVQAGSDEIQQIRNTDGVVNVLHWLGKPAIIHADEIEAMKGFIADHPNVELEKISVDPMGVSRHSVNSSYAIEGKMVTIKNNTLKVSLPSLGFNMIAKVEDESLFGRESIIQSNTFAHS